jgi:hypothetical protein
LRSDVSSTGYIEVREELVIIKWRIMVICVRAMATHRRNMDRIAHDMNGDGGHSFRRTTMEQACFRVCELGQHGSAGSRLKKPRTQKARKGTGTWAPVLFPPTSHRQTHITSKHSFVHALGW